MTRGAETKTQTARRFVGRVSVVIVFFVLAATSLVARAIHLQVLDKDFLNQQADTRHLRTERITAHRGSVTDRNGEPLAISTPVDSIWVNPKELAHAVDRVPELARALGLDADLTIRRITRSMDKEFVYLKRHLSPDKAANVLALELPGVNVQREYRRYYPAGEVTGHLVGFTDIDDQGQEGLELAFNHWLAGESGAKRVLKDRLGRSVENVESIRPPRHGKALRSSIDLRIQYLAYRTLKAAIRQYNAVSGSIVVLDIRTGEVLAIVNQPSYNPNDRSQFSAERYRNRAITDIFEPGSSIKPLVVAAALESGQYRPSSIIDTAPGFVTVGPKKIEDRRNLGRVSLTTILARSSNVGVTKLAMSLPAEQLWSTMTSLGFGELTASGFPGGPANALRSLEADQPGDARLRLRHFGNAAAARAGLRIARRRWTPAADIAGCARRAGRRQAGHFAGHRQCRETHARGSRPPWRHRHESVGHGLSNCRQDRHGLEIRRRRIFGGQVFFHLRRARTGERSAPRCGRRHRRAERRALLRQRRCRAGVLGHHGRIAAAACHSARRAAGP